MPRLPLSRLSGVRYSWTEPPCTCAGVEHDGREVNKSIEILQNLVYIFTMLEILYSWVYNLVGDPFGDILFLYDVWPSPAVAAASVMWQQHQWWGSSISGVAAASLVWQQHHLCGSSITGVAGAIKIQPGKT